MQDVLFINKPFSPVLGRQWDAVEKIALSFSLTRLQAYYPLTQQLTRLSVRLS